MFTEVIKNLKECIKEIYCKQVSWDKDNLTPTQTIIIDKMVNLIFVYDGDAQKALDNLDNSISLQDIIKTQNL